MALRRGGRQPWKYQDAEHDGCGGRAGKVELITGIEGVQPAGAEDPYMAIRQPVLASGLLA
jgi:hypothetical protein